MQLFGGGAEFAKKKDIANPNLITGSKDFTGSKWVNIPENVQKDKYLDFTAINVNWAWQGISQYIAVNKGETFTASMYVKAPAGPSVSWFINLPDNETNYKRADTNPTGITITTTGDWQRTSITFTVTGDSGVIKPRLEAGGSGGFWIAGMKLERGTNATPWCPAYEDYVAKPDFDKKINIDNQVGSDPNNCLPASDNWSDIFGVNTGSSWTDRHNLLRVGQTQATDYFYGKNSSALFFGSGDTKGGLEVHYTDHEARIVGGNNPKILWSERIAWKSDIQNLEQEISDLKKQVDQLKQGK